MKRWFRIVSCLLIALLIAGNAEFVKDIIRLRQL